MDVYRGKGKVQTHFLNVGLYISLFPQLIAGPIVRYETVANEIENRKENLNDFAMGVNRFIIGLGKKVLLANQFAVVSDTVFGNVTSTGTTNSFLLLWMGAIAYTLQIFFDFAGYSDMAIGLGRMFGFHFLENFKYPYISKSISEFWRRWHISLQTWFKDYIYIPLGGSRVNSKTRLVFNIFVVWFLTGVWHGANWTFVVWGLFHGCFLMLEEFVPKLQKLPRVVAHIYSLLVVTVGFVIFRADTLSQGWMFIRKMFSDFSMSAAGNSLAMQQMTPWFIFILVIAVLCAAPVNSLVKGIRSKMTEGSKGLAVCGTIKSVFTLVLLLWCMIRLSGNAYNPFIYFRF